jgi:acetylornithine/succinyldiaminopimelate/putrescine aminotransferase
MTKKYEIIGVPLTPVTHGITFGINDEASAAGVLALQTLLRKH